VRFIFYIRYRYLHLRADVIQSKLAANASQYVGDLSNYTTFIEPDPIVGKVYYEDDTYHEYVVMSGFTNLGSHPQGSITEKVCDYSHCDPPWMSTIDYSIKPVGNTTHRTTYYVTSRNNFAGGVNDTASHDIVV
jgi:hypothetical protein